MTTSYASQANKALHSAVPYTNSSGDVTSWMVSVTYSLEGFEYTFTDLADNLETLKPIDQYTKSDIFNLFNQDGFHEVFNSQYESLSVAIENTPNFEFDINSIE